MSQQDKLRKTLREYYDTQQVPFNDNEWEHASAYLNAARRGRRIRRGAVSVAALLSTLLISLFIFPKLTSNDAHLASSKSDQTLKFVPIPPAVVLNTSATPEPVTGISGNPNTPKKSGHTINATVSGPASRKNIPEVQAGFSLVKSSALSASNLVDPALDPTEPDNRINEGKTMDTNPFVMPIASINITTNNKGEEDHTKHEMPLDSKDNIKVPPVPVENLTPNSDPWSEKEIPKASGDMLPQTEAPMALKDSKKEITRPEEKLPATAADTSHHSSITDTTTAMEIATVDTLPGSSSLNFAGEGIFYEAGVAWFYGWKGPLNRDARGFSPLAGINYMNRLSRRCALSFGLQYIQVPDLSNSSKTSRVYSYVYGEQSRVTVITPSTLHYVLAPLRFHYYVDYRNCFGGGFNLSYLLNIDATVTSYDEKPGYNGNYETVKRSGYTEGFSWFDSQVAMLYRRRISSSLALQVEFFFGLTDVKQDEFFRYTSKERNSGAKLSLIYYAFRKNNR